MHHGMHPCMYAVLSFFLLQATGSLDVIGDMILTTFRPEDHFSK